MGTLYLVRHGQASFGSHDYDRLSELGHRQCRALGEHFRSMNLRFATVLTGTLRRHRETYEGIAEGLAQSHTPEVCPGLDEYDPDTDVDGNAVRTINPSYIFHWDEHSKVMASYEWIETQNNDPDDNVFTLRYQYSF